MQDKYIFLLIMIILVILGQILKRNEKKYVKENSKNLKENINKDIEIKDIEEEKEENKYLENEKKKENNSEDKYEKAIEEFNKYIIHERKPKENYNKDKSSFVPNAIKDTVKNIELFRNRENINNDYNRNEEAEINYNETLMQYFEWNTENDGTLYEKLRKNAKELSEAGITAVWLPPACKAVKGINDVGYGIYDLYDLGEFNQKGTVRTKYGTKKQYIDAIKEAHQNNIKVYADIVFNHKAGADETEIVKAVQVDYCNRNMPVGAPRNIKCHTVFNFEGRNNKYSDYKWSAKDFTGVDYDELSHNSGIFKFYDKSWAKDVDPENGNYDYLMFSDIDVNSADVRQELIKWGKWFIDETGIDGFRLDAVKHIQFDFFTFWLKEMRRYKGRDMFAVGEYWAFDTGRLKYYMKKSGECMNLFDVPLHFAFHEASKSFGYFDMRELLNRSMLKEYPYKTCTFVDNHDTQLGQSLQSWVEDWFKPLAYTFILTRQEGYPCVFYGDYYGVNGSGYNGMKEVLDIILKARKYYAYGVQHDYFDNESIVGWTREGDEIHDNSGLAVLITDECGGEKKMYVGEKFADCYFVDITKNINENVRIDYNGYGVFKVRDGSYSIYIMDK